MNYANTSNAEQSLADFRQHGPRFNQEVLTDLYREQSRINTYCHDLQNAGDIVPFYQHFEAQDLLQRDDAMRGLITIINSNSVGVEIAGITPDSHTGNICIRYRLKGENNEREIKANDPRCEPLCYPLFHPYGEPGYSDILLKTHKIKFAAYLRCRLLQPELNLTTTNKSGEITDLAVNRFNLMSRLSQYYIVENLSRSIDYRLKFQKNNRGKFFGLSSDELNEHDAERAHKIRERLGNGAVELDDELETHDNFTPSYLAESFFGGPRHLKKLAVSALTIVSHLGNFNKCLLFLFGAI